MLKTKFVTNSNTKTCKWDGKSIGQVYVYNKDTMKLKLMLGICMVSAIGGFSTFWIYNLLGNNVFLSIFASNFTTALFLSSYYIPLYSKAKKTKYSGYYKDEKGVIKK